MLIKTREEIEKILKSGKILAQVAKEVMSSIAPGISLKSLDDLARELIKKAGAKPAFLGYRPYGAKRPYPCSICASVNEVIVHGIPTDYKLKEGDLVKVDFGVINEGWYADAAWTIAVGEVSPKAQKLIEVTKEALNAGIKQARIGKNLGDIGWAINSTVKNKGFKIVEGLTGHGVGEELHEDPSVYNTGKKGSGMVLKSGMVLVIMSLTPISAIAFVNCLRS